MCLSSTARHAIRIAKVSLLLASGALLLPGCASGSARALAEATVIHGGDQIRVACHFECDRLGSEALRTAELAWAAVAELLEAVPPPAGGRRPVIHLWGSLAEYRLIESRVAGGQFRDVGGFSSRAQRVAHVLILDDLPPAYLEHTRLPVHYRRNVAHEAAHLATYDLALGAYWPPWLAEGMAGWVERQVVDRTRPTGEMAIQEANPWAATHLWRVQRLLAADALPSVTDVLTGAPLALSLADAYALWTELFDFLLSGAFASETRALVREVAATRIPEASAWPAVAEIARRVFREEGFERADQDFRRHIRSLQPGWVEALRSLEETPTGLGAWLQHAVTDVPAGAIAWRTGVAGPAEGFRVQGSVLPLGEAPWEFRIALARVGGSPLLVGVDSEGRVQLLELDGDRPELVSTTASSALPAPPPGVDMIHFSVRFLPGEITVQVDGDPEGVTFPVPGAEPEGVWGVGVASGTSVLWEGLEVSRGR